MSANPNPGPYTAQTGYNPNNINIPFKRTLTVNSTAVIIKSTPGHLMGWNINNRDSGDIYVKFYNSGSVTPSTDVPELTLHVPPGSIYEAPNKVKHSFTNAIAVRAVTGSSDTNAGNPTTLPIIELKYY